MRTIRLPKWSLVILAGCVRMRWLVGRRAQFLAFGGWAAVVLSMALSALLGGRLGEGRAANGVVGRIVANAAERGKAAVASDGFMDDLLFFMLPEKTRLVSLARERDPAYGRELSEWVRGMSRSLGSKSNNGGSDSLPDFACQHVEDEGEVEERRGDSAVRLPPSPSPESDAWAIFKTIVDKVEPWNYGAYVNLLGMVRRGCDGPGVRRGEERPRVGALPPGAA